MIILILMGLFLVSFIIFMIYIIFMTHIIFETAGEMSERERIIDE